MSGGDLGRDPWTTVVVDVGARYGLHPSWRAIEAPLEYRMFEPEPTEAARLERKYANRRDVTVFAEALGSVPDSTLELFITSHRGYVGSTPPNPDSLWFAQIRPGEGGVEGRITVPATTLDRHLARFPARVDFLKIDVEGHELAVLEGAAGALDDVLALRVEVQFDEAFGGQTASALFTHLIDRCGFRLMRLDYDGRGQPLSYLTADGAYGALCGCDAVFARREGQVADRGGEEAAAGLIKLAVFALRNGFPDFAVVCLERLEASGWRPAGEEPALRRYLRKLFILAATRVRAQSGELYENAVRDYRRFFDAAMPARHEVFESEWLNPT